MKRVETVNINGIVFSIDDDACKRLGAYLDALVRYFENERGGGEIIADIEARISELFAERSGGRVITFDDVARVIETLGTPEDIAGDGCADAETQAQKPQKSLYRDPDRRYLGGVCAGLAAWLGISPVIVRLVFIFFTFFYGMAIPAYILLWIFLPIARTAAHKLEMRGEPVTVSNIERSIRESLSDPSLRQSFNSFLNEAGELFGRIAGIFGRVVGVLFGVFMLLGGIAIAIGLTVVMLMQDIVFNQSVEWDFLSFTDLFRNIISTESYILLLICATVVLSLPAFALIFWGVKLITGFMVKYRMPHVALALLWLIAAVTGVITCISQVRNFAWSNGQIVETRQMALPDTLHIAVAPSNLQISNNPMEVYFDKDNRRFYGKPELHIRKSDDGQLKMSIYRKSQGESKRAAYRYAESITYGVEVRDSLLTLDPYFTITPQDRWKFQNLDIELHVPVGTVIVDDGGLYGDRILGRVFRRGYSAVHTWVMTDGEGLQPVSNDGEGNGE